MINTERYAVSVCNLGEQSLFLGGRWILLDRPGASVAIAYDIVVGHKSDRAGRYAIKVVFGVA